MVSEHVNSNERKTKAEERAASIEDALKSFFSPDNVEMKSVLDAKHVVHIVQLMAFAKYFECDIAEYIAIILLKARVSVKGLGLEDITKILTAALNRPDETDGERERQNMVRRLLG